MLKKKKKKKKNLLLRNVFLRHLWTILLKCNPAALLIIKPWRQGTFAFPLLPDSLIFSPVISFTWTVHSHSHTLDLIITNNVPLSKSVIQSAFPLTTSLLFLCLIPAACPNNPLVIILHCLWAIRPLTHFLPIPLLPTSFISHLI